MHLLRQVVALLPCLAAVQADLLTPYYPAPSDLSGKGSLVASSWDKVTKSLDAYLSGKTNTSSSAAAAGLLKNTTFSLGLFSVNDPDAADLQYHYTAPEIAKGPNGVKKVDGDSIYHVASVSKLFTVLAGLLNMKDEDWDRPLTDVLGPLSDFIKQKGDDLNPVTDTQWDKVTLSALAAQMGGVPRGTFPYSPGDILVQYEVAKATNSVTPDVEPKFYGLPPMDINDPGVFPECAMDMNCNGDDFTEIVSDKASVFLPWASPGYANNGFMLLGLAIENVTGKSIHDLYKDSIFTPLDMSHSLTDSPPKSDWDRCVIAGTADEYATPGNLTVPSGGILSSTNDYAKLGVGILNSTLLPADKTRKWMKPVSHTSDLHYSVGKPWEIYRYTHSSGVISDIYTKFGDSGYYTSYMVLLPDFNAGFSILAASVQSGRSSAASLIADVITESFLPALMEQSALEAQRNFAGTYVFTDENLDSKLTLDIKHSPNQPAGLGLKEWISNGTNVLRPQVLAGLGINNRSKFVPTVPLNEKTGQIAFRPYTPTVAKPGKTQGLFSNFYDISDWVVVDSSTYADFSPVYLVFDVEDGKAKSVSLPGYRVTLERKD
ncbi:hypothetical protein FE257_001715 [Aspergillus nanangensis]|uniref:Beta-lactamase-related domain-containing protein n=1 Tax=Aspergillus nanangensis TaxID=2582783 RepID=A0AAD4CDY6_ASPNN|nr:hypothetical protein FE257_001715 [Aspergillus nanangensis]